MIRVVKASKVYNKGEPNQVRAVWEVSLHVRQGEMAVVRGPSGSGKTTLLTLIGCFSRPSSGEIHVAGKPISRLPEKFMTLHRRKHVGMMFQQFNLVHDLSVEKNVAIPLYPLQLSARLIDDRVEALLHMVHLVERRAFPVKRLSGGEQQRVAIARALANDPEIVLADEPTAHLDTALSAELMTMLQALKAEGRTVVIASHDPEVYTHPSVDRVLEMKDGCMSEV
jgi:putative ABC transport system ATP-binding protein